MYYILDNLEKKERERTHFTGKNLDFIAVVDFPY